MAPDAPATEGLEVPRPLRLILTAGWSLTESAGLPTAAYLLAGAGIFLLLTAGLGVLMVTEPAGTFLTFSTAVTIVLVVAGTGVSTLWFLSVLRRLGLKLRFAPSLSQAGPG